MHSLGKAIALGLLKGVVLGLAAGLALSYGLGLPMPAGSLLGYLAAMGVAGTTGVAGGRAPWREGAWIVASIKMLAGVAVGALAYWLLTSYLDAQLPVDLAARLALPEGSLDEAGGVSWLAVPSLALTTISALFGLLVEIDHVGEEDEKSEARGGSGRTKTSTSAGRTKNERARLEAADTELETRGAPRRRSER